MEIKIVSIEEAMKLLRIKDDSRCKNNEIYERIRSLEHGQAIIAEVDKPKNLVSALYTSRKKNRIPTDLVIRYAGNHVIIYRKKEA